MSEELKRSLEMLALWACCLGLAIVAYMSHARIQSLEAQVQSLTSKP